MLFYTSSRVIYTVQTLHTYTSFKATRDMMGVPKTPSQDLLCVASAATSSHGTATAGTNSSLYLQTYTMVLIY